MTMVRMLQQMSGTRNGAPWPEVGEELEVSKEEALTLCSGQTPIAVVVPDPAVPSRKATEASGDEDATTKEDGAGEAETGTPAQTKPASSSATRARASGTAKK